MKECPILFSAEMVRAILDGRKTQTRRLVRENLGNRGGPVGDHVKYWRRGEEDPARWCGCDGLGSLGWVECPYGAPGDRLWVRETFSREDAIAPSSPGGVYYRADAKPFDRDSLVWRPSIFMPRALSRITLDVVAVRVERLQDITEADARAEGYPLDASDRGAQLWFARLWDRINAKRAPWSSNPWVWVVTFKRAEAS